MSKQEIIDQTVQLLEQLPEEKATEIRDFAAFLLARKELMSILTQNLPTTEPAEALHSDVQAAVSHSKAYDFLHDEPDLYSDNDLLERYK